MEIKLTSQELYDKLNPQNQESITAQLLADGLSVNMSDYYSRLIKDAARCNDYNSDIVYDINHINKRFAEYRGGYFEPIWIGFRRHGVDGTSFILSRLQNYDTPFECIHKEYFVVYSITVAETDYEGFYDIYFSKYLT